MTLPVLFLILAVFLVVLLLLIMSREEVEGRLSPDLDDPAPCECQYLRLPPQLVLRIFSREDREFISQMHSPRLQRIYRSERRRLALLWVRRTSQEVSKIIMNHRLTARENQNLDVANEGKLFFTYLELRLICGSLIFLIRLFGPHALTDLATCASGLYQSLGRALPDAPGTNRVASPSNLSTM